MIDPLDHLGLVYKAALKYQSRCNALTLEDLTQEGFIGLMKAVKKWDPKKGRFSTCAVPWIEDAIRKVIMKDSIVKIPDGKYKQGYAQSKAVTEDVLLSHRVEFNEPENLKHVLKKLTPEQKYIVTLYFGLDWYGERTHAEIGKEMGFTGRWSNKILKSALEVMRE